jgi:hypothetical protein
MVELAELLDALIKRLDVRIGRIVAGIIAVAALAGFIFLIIRDSGSLLPLLPAFLTILLLGGGYWLIHRHLLASSEPDDSPAQAGLAPALAPQVDISVPPATSPKNSFAMLTLEVSLAGAVGGVIGITLLIVWFVRSTPDLFPLSFQPVRPQDTSPLVMLIVFPLVFSIAIGWVAGVFADRTRYTIGYKPAARRVFRDTCALLAGAVAGPLGLIMALMALG